MNTYLVNFVKKLPRKVRTKLKMIRVRREKVSDFYVHLNGLEHETGFYMCDVIYRKKGLVCRRTFKFKLA